MKREIKFRAWHKYERKLCDIKTLTDKGAFLVGVSKGKDTLMDGGKQIIIAPNDGRFCDNDEIELMQYTGLKDSNGKEIYEGDIVTFYDFFGGKFYAYAGEWEEEYEDMTGDIIFNIGDFCIQHHGHAVITDAIPLSQIIGYINYEVIGNIHENPELIKS